MAAFALTVVSALALVAPPARLGAPASRAGRGVPARPMAAARVAMGAINIDGVRIGPPPDLPSLLLHNRIVYVGTGLVPQVAELIVAQLLYIQARFDHSPAAARPGAACPPDRPPLRRDARARALARASRTRAV